MGLKGSSIRIGIAALVVAVAGMTAPAVAAADATPPEVVDITASPADVSVNGLGHAVVTLSVHLRDPSGVVRAVPVEGDFPWPVVSLSNTTPGAAMRFATAYLTLPPTEDPTDGTWVGSFLAPANADGTWRVSGVAAIDGAGNQGGVDPATLGIDARVTVHGTHRPAVTVGFAPQPAKGNQPVTMKGRAYFVDDGSPIASRRITIGWGQDGCSTQNILGNATTTTDAFGYYGFTFRPPLDQLRGCAFLTDPTVAPFDAYGPIAVLAWRLRPLVVKYAMTTNPVPSGIRLGQAVRVTGKVVPISVAGGQGPIHLQRRLATGRWVNVDTRSLRSDGSYSLRVVPSRRGTFRYRVYMPSCCDGTFVGTTSRILVITVR